MEIRSGAVREPITQDVTTPRQTPDRGERFRAALEASAESLLSGAANAAAGVPGVPLLSAAIRGDAGTGSIPVAESAESPTTATAGTTEGANDMASVMKQSQEFNLYYLQIQEEMSQENRRFSALSNVMKARHETSKTAIGNIR
jgi:hypothetical protein